MRFGTSFFNGTVFKKTVLRYWPLWGAYFAVWLVLLPLNGLMTLQYSTGRGANGAIGNFAIDTVPATAQGFGLGLMVVFGALCAMAVFGHLYNPRSANFFGSLPVRREGLFLTHYLAGLAFLMAPNLMVFLLTLLVELAGGYVCWAGLGFWLAVLCGEGFFFYSLAVFCAMFTGNILALPVFYGIVNVLAVGLYGLLELVFRGFYYGFAGFPDGVQAVAKWLTPALCLNGAVNTQSVNVVEEFSQLTAEDLELVARVGGVWVSDNRYMIVRGLGTVGIYAIVAVVLAVCAFLLYRVRRLESAGDVVAVNPMKPVFQYGVALCVGMAFGMATAMVAGGGEVMLMAAMLVWGVLGYFAARMLLEKSFKVFRHWKGALAVAAVFVALFCVVGYDLTGFETRVPNPASVDSVYVRGINGVCLGDDGDYLSLDVTDPEAVELLATLHRLAVEQRDWDWRNESECVTTNLNLEYRLKGGGTLSRRYDNVWLDPRQADQEGTAAWAVQRLYDDRELYWQEYGFAQLEEVLANGARLDRVEMGCYREADGAYESGFLYAADARTVLAAVKEDFFAGRIGVRRVDDQEHWHGGPEEDFLQFFSGEVPLGDAYTSYAVKITLQDTASSTLAALDALSDELELNGVWTEGFPDTQTG